MIANRLSALSLCLVIGLAALTGCQPPPPPKTTETVTTQPVVSTAEKIAAYRASVEKVKPGSIVGIVLAVQPEYNLAAVGDIPVQDFKVGQTLSFVDTDGNGISNGQVKNITNEMLIVKYDTQGKRPPEKGDLTLWLKE